MKYLTLTLALCLLLVSCKSTKNHTNKDHISVVGVWEYQKTDIDLNTILPFDNIVEKTFSAFMNMSKEFNVIQGDIEFTEKGHFIANKLNCKYNVKNDKVKLNLSLLEMSKVNTYFIIEQPNKDELILIYDAKETAKPYLTGIKGLALSAIKKGNIVIVFKRKA